MPANMKHTSDKTETTVDGVADKTDTDIDYCKTIVPIDGSQIVNRRISDVYVIADGNEEEVLRNLDKTAEELSGKRAGVIGHLSYCYVLLTVFYILGDFESARGVLDMMLTGVTAAESYAMTGKFLNADGTPCRAFTDIAVGSEDDFSSIRKYAADCLNFAKLVHAKAQSFESGYSMLVSSLLVHLLVKDMASAMDDCKGLRKVIGEIGDFIDAIANRERLEPDHSANDHGDLSNGFVPYSDEMLDADGLPEERKP